MSKYIIELDYDLQRVVGVGVKQGTVWVKDYDVDDLEELCADYINEHFGQLQDDAYKRGFEDGKGAIHAGCAGCQNEGTKIFELPCSTCRNAYPNHWTAKMKDDEIKVGDEVIYNEHKFIVFATETEEHYASLFDVNGRHASASQRECKKTGRHFDIEGILREVME